MEQQCDLHQQRPWILEACHENDQHDLPSHQKAPLQGIATSSPQTCILAVSLVRTYSFHGHATCSDYLTGEDALANLSVERTKTGTITGHVRIQSKTQGIALSLGDRIMMGAFSATPAEESIR